MDSFHEKVQIKNSKLEPLEISEFSEFHALLPAWVYFQINSIISGQWEYILSTA